MDRVGTFTFLIAETKCMTKVTYGEFILAYNLRMQSIVLGGGTDRAGA